MCTVLGVDHDVQAQYLERPQSLAVDATEDESERLADNLANLRPACILEAGQGILPAGRQQITFQLWDGPDCIVFHVNVTLTLLLYADIGDVATWVLRRDVVRAQAHTSVATTSVHESSGGATRHQDVDSEVEFPTTHEERRIDVPLEDALGTTDALEITDGVDHFDALASARHRRLVDPDTLQGLALVVVAAEGGSGPREIARQTVCQRVPRRPVLALPADVHQESDLRRATLTLVGAPVQEIHKSSALQSSDTSKVHVSAAHMPAQPRFGKLRGHLLPATRVQVVLDHLDVLLNVIRPRTTWRR
mmetsp:Transcript_107524/g.302655  ORF Transcript_107524/g.302655 Transcript_107524/m.302655 type:complete len:306 (-) Transcript_107524:186-1103(-)